jgi:hypothetical protein
MDLDNLIEQQRQTSDTCAFMESMNNDNTKKKVWKIAAGHMQ